MLPEWRGNRFGNKNSLETSLVGISLLLFARSQAHKLVPPMICRLDEVYREARSKQTDATEFP